MLLQLASLLFVGIFAQLEGAHAEEQPVPKPAPTLEPVDEAARKPDFLAFRLQLQDTVKKKDVEALLPHIAGNIQLGKTNESGLDAFRKFWKLDESPGDSKLWQELNDVLRLGGAFLEDGRFLAPYVYAKWPRDVDRFDYAVVTGSNVYIRAKPIRESPHVAQLSYAIVRNYPVSRGELVIDTLGGETYPWRKIGLPEGNTAFVWGKFVRSPLEYRAVFEKIDGVWQLSHFVSGE